MRYVWAAAVATAALALVMESWARGYPPGDPGHVAGRMRNVISLGGLAAGLALVSLLPLGAVLRTGLVGVATAGLLAAAAYRLGWL